VSLQTTDTVERIVDAAERLFLEKGLGGVSVRAVTAEAGTNVAAVNYHFGSKAELLRAMVRRVFGQVGTEQFRLLEQLESKVQAPPVEELLGAFAAPIFALFDAQRAGDWGRAWMAARDADRAGREAGHERPPMMFVDTAVTRRYHGALSLALPHLPPDELWWRFERANNLLMANQGMRATARAAATLGSAAADPPKQDERRWLLTFLAGALSASASD